ncbi:MAG: restriction endonuclease subunit S, partial [Bacteroidales bacterium]|nr:restriction endonuclease subunit S [Bacteroidales bacterium]
NDIYMIKSGATTGKVAIVDTDRIFTIWSPLAVFRCNTRILIPNYMFYYLQSHYYQFQVSLNWSFGTQQNIGMRSLEKIDIALPPLTEQTAIAAYLDDKTAQIDSIIGKCEKQIEQLSALRRSLIAEAVTGKIKVC